MGFDPATLMAGSLILGGIGTGVQAIGAVQSAGAQQAQANYQAQVALNNQQIANQYAANAAQVGQANIQQAQLKNRANLGAIEAAQGASGLDVNSGSNVDVRAGAREIGQLNTLNTAQQAQQQVYGYRVAGVNYAAQAGLEQATAAQAPIAGAFGAGGSLLGGASSLAGNWSRYQLLAGSNNPANVYAVTG